MADKPLWRKVFDRVDRTVAPALEGFVQTSVFADALSAGVKLQGALQQRIERQTRQLWHTANLPAGSDVSRLREQVAALDHQLRQLSTALAVAQKDAAQKDAAQKTATQKTATQKTATQKTATQKTAARRETAHADDAQPANAARHGRPDAARGRARRATHP